MSVFCRLPLVAQIAIWTALAKFADLIHRWLCGEVPYLP